MIPVGFFPIPAGLCGSFLFPELDPCCSWGAGAQKEGVNPKPGGEESRFGGVLTKTDSPGSEGSGRQGSSDSSSFAEGDEGQDDVTESGGAHGLH